MLEVVVSGLVTGLAIAVPIGAVGALMVTLTARTSWRVGSAAALGVSTVDGVYAAVAVLGGAALAMWQLGLALAGAGLGRTVTAPRGRLVTGLVSAVVVAGLAVRTILG